MRSTCLVALAVVGSFGCQTLDESELTSELPSDLPSAQIDTSIARPSEDLPLSIAQQNGHFSGYYCSGGDLVVGVTESATNDDVNQIVNLVRSNGVAFYCRNREVPNHEPDVLVANQRYSFLQLRTWRDSLLPEIARMKGARGLGIDYKTNQIVLGVELGQQDLKRAAVAQHGLPSDAIRAVEQGPISLRSDPNFLGETFRPIPAGVRIESTDPMTGGNWGGCTLTLGATQVSTGQNGWVTATHCLGHPDPYMGQVKSFNVFQPLANSQSNRIGTETVDPGYFFCLQGGFNCRYTDSTWIRQEAGTANKGQIAQTLSWNGNSNCCANQCAACTMSTASPRFHVYGSASAVTGMQVEKVGITSGWTTGTVTNTCYDTPDGEGHWLLCQINSTNFNQNGDSGSPVFYWWSAYGVNTVQMVGLLWGGDSFSPTYSSSWSRVASELGAMDIVFAPSFQVSAETANDVGVGSNGAVWIITNSAAYGGFTIKRLNGTSWELMPGAATRIAVGPDGNAWVVNIFGNIFRWTGSTWQQISGAATDVGIGGDGSVWVIGTTPTNGGFPIFRWAGSHFWNMVDGGAVKIAVDPSGNPWVTASDFTIHQRIGGVGGYWQQKPGSGRDIGIAGDGMVWTVGTGAVSGGYAPQWWSGIDWVPSTGGATAISVARGGKPSLVSSSNQLLQAQ